MNNTREKIQEIIMTLDLGYSWQMSEYATSDSQEKEFERAGLMEIERVTNELTALIEPRPDVEEILDFVCERIEVTYMNAEQMGIPTNRDKDFYKGVKTVLRSKLRRFQDDGKKGDGE